MMSRLPDRSHPPQAAVPAFVSLGERMLGSASFQRLFSEGMRLVEETANYLDGDGREEARALPRAAGLAYATESMRLTTRLMQIASWLLIQRAVKEGEISPEQAAKEIAKIRLARFRAPVSPETFEALPVMLRALMARADRLQERVRHLQAQLAEPPAAAENPVESQLDLIRTAFGRSFG